jgi:carbon monoxide dehydrogenase subunit G
LRMSGFRRIRFFERWVMHRFVALVLLLFLPVMAIAQDGARVSVETTQNGVRVKGEVVVHATRAIAWDALTDYEDWVRFMPDLQVSRVVSREPLRVVQRGSLPWLFGFPIVVLADVVETPKDRVSFSKIQGNLLFLEGEWRIKGKDGALRLSYSAEVIPGVPLPPSLTSGIIEADTRAKVEAMAREIMRRAEEGSQQ